MIDGKGPSFRDFCCYLSGEMNCTNKDCMLVAAAALMAGFLIGGFIFIL